MAKNRTRFFYLLVASAAVLLSISLWFSSAQPPQFDGPEMAFQKDLPRNKYPKCMQPGQKSGVRFEHFGTNCRLPPSLLREIFNPAEAVSDAAMDLRGGAFRFIGRTDRVQASIVIPGIECASAKLQNSLYGSACLITMPPGCKGENFGEFDAYARAYNTAAIIKPDQSSSLCN